MAEYVVNMLRGLRAYLWTYLVERLGPLWWGVALAAGLVAYVLCSAQTRRTGAGRAKALAAGLLAAYLAVVVAATVLSRGAGAGFRLDFLAWKGLVGLVRGGHARPEDLANVAMLVPVGLLLPVVTGRCLSRTALSCAALSVCVEAVQYIFAVGWPDPLDVALNTLGAVAGYGPWALVIRLTK